MYAWYAPQDADSAERNVKELRRVLKAGSFPVEPVVALGALRERVRDELGLAWDARDDAILDAIRRLKRASA